MTFDREDPSADFAFFQNGPVTLFFKESVLDQALNELIGLGYTVSEVRTETRETIYEDIGQAYEWERLFGYAPPNNLNALIDGVTDGNGPRRVVVLRAFDAFHARDPEFAVAIADVLALCSDRNLLVGERLAVFLQVDDPRFQLTALGARDATWNPAEWMNRDRGL